MGNQKIYIQLYMSHVFSKLKKMTRNVTHSVVVVLPLTPSLGKATKT